MPGRWASSVGAAGARGSSSPGCRGSGRRPASRRRRDRPGCSAGGPPARCRPGRPARAPGAPRRRGSAGTTRWPPPPAAGRCGRASRTATSASRERSEPSGRLGTGRVAVRPATQHTSSCGPNGRVPQHDVQAGHGLAGGGVDGEPGGVADDVEAGVRRAPSLRRAGRAAGGAPRRRAASSLRRFSRRELVIRRPSDSLSMTAGARPVDGAHRGGRVPAGRRAGRGRAAARRRAGRARRGGGASSRACQGCSGSAAVPGGQGGARPGQPGGQPVGGDRAAALGPRRSRWPAAERSTAIQCSGKAPRGSGE